MYLKSLEISGFKSFAKKAILEFNCPITSIVGPNGSGKSNVAEAFRFVLGEQSIKSLRGKRGEDLLFNGGKSLGRLNRASVKVIFDNSKRFLNIDFDEVSLERVVHRDSANEYFINGSPARLKDIIELLAQAHIGPSGHHIISQGEADKILNANARERKEMIEDALGLKIYHYKKEESQRKLEKTEENLKQVDSLRKEIAPHIKFLGKQVEKIQKTREMKIELEHIAKDYFKRENLFIQSERKKNEDMRREPEERLKFLEEELKKAKDVLSRSDQKDAKSQELLDLETKIKNLRDMRDTIVRDSGRIEGQIASEERILRKQQELVHSEDDKVVHLKDIESIARTIYTEIQDAESKEDIPTLKHILRGIRSLLENFISNNKTKTDISVIADSEKEIERLKHEKTILNDKLNEVSVTEGELNKQYSHLQIEIDKEKDSNRDAEKAVFRIMADQNEVISMLNSLKSQYERLQMIDAEFKRDLREIAVLAGRNVFDFEQYSLVNQDGVEISMEEIMNEDHRNQEDRRKAIERIKIRLEDAGGGGEDVLKEYQDAVERDQFLAREIEDLMKSSETLKTLIVDLEQKLDTEFKAGIQKINKQFGDFFALMFGGGSAHLDVIREKKRRKKLDTDLSEDDTHEEFVEEEGEEGIEISVNLPLKRIKGLVMLSGGERALTSIALLFAISQVNPPPFIILDETDAALDEANSRKYGDMISSLSEYSQLILITHNRETMSRAGILYGITMGSEGFSKLLSIQFDEALQVAK